MICNICDYGAVPDGVTMNTAAIQSAIDTCAENGGGTVLVPAGLFMTGSLFLRSHVELHLAHGSVLKASSDLADYNALDAYPQNMSSEAERWKGHHVVMGIEIEDAAITGTGCIDGNGVAFFAELRPDSYRGELSWRDGYCNVKDKEIRRPGQMIVFAECKNIVIQDVFFRDSTCWTILIHGCEEVRIRGVKIKNPGWNANTDGIDIDCSRNVTISDCLIDTGDDALTLRGSFRTLKDQTRICENIAVSNCVCHARACGIRIGVGNGTIRNAVFSNITFAGSGAGIQIQSSYWAQGKGVDISNLRFVNINCRGAAYPVNIGPGMETATAQIEDIVFSQCTFEVFYPLTLSGNAQTRPRNIRFENVDFIVADAPHPFREYPAPEIFLRLSAVDDITFRASRIHWKTKDPWWKQTLAVQDVNDLEIAPDCRFPEPENHTGTLSLDERPFAT